MDKEQFVAVGGYHVVEDYDSVIGGGYGTILTFPDGVNWAKQNSGTEFVLFDISWNGSQFIAVGEFGNILGSGEPGKLTPTPTTTHLYASFIDAVYAYVIATSGCPLP